MCIYMIMDCYTTYINTFKTMMPYFVSGALVLSKSLQYGPLGGQVKVRPASPGSLGTHVVPSTTAPAGSAFDLCCDPGLGVFP